MPLTYAGAKTGYLGYAINHLIEYAGTIDHFVDLFGGAANASIAVNHTNNVEYHINEIDLTLVNYYYVISDEHLYTQYIEELCKLSNELNNALKNNTAIEQGKRFFNNYEDTLRKWHEKYLIQNTVPCCKKNFVHLSNFAKYHSESERNKIDAAVAYTYTHCFPTTGGNFSRGAVTDLLLNIIQIERPIAIEVLNNLLKVYVTVMLHRILITTIKNYYDYLGKDGKQRLFHTLFYSDSPYLNTAGYPGGGIETDQMKTLIERLINASTKESHFIFSCRASKSIEDSKFQKLIKIIGNFKYFKELDPEEIYTDRTYIEEANYKRKDLFAKRYLEDAIKLLAENQSIYQNIFLCSTCILINSRENIMFWYA